MSGSSERLVDVSHTVEDGLVTYKGLPAPVVCDYLSYEESQNHYAEGTEFQIGKIEMVANTGTYVDAPSHRYRGREDLAQIPLESLANLDALVVRVDRDAKAIDASFFEGLRIEGRAVLVETGWSRHWNTEQYFEGHPFLTADAAAMLRDAGVKLVGIDSLNIDDTHDGNRPVHSTLLREGIPVAEHLNALHRLPDSGFRFFAVPVKVRGMGTFPVRAFGVVE